MDSTLIRIGADIALGILLIEALVLVVYRRRTGQGLPYVTIATISAAGFALLLALRLTLAEAPAPLIGLALALGGLAHGVDLYRRLARIDRA